MATLETGQCVQFSRAMIDIVGPDGRMHVTPAGQLQVSVDGELVDIKGMDKQTCECGATKTLHLETMDFFCPQCRKIEELELEVEQLTMTNMELMKRLEKHV